MKCKPPDSLTLAKTVEKPTTEEGTITVHVPVNR